MSALLALRLAHILTASIALGATVAFQLWLRLARREPEHLAFAIRGIRSIDRRIAEPAYFLAFGTGAGLVLTGAASFSSGWLAIATAIYAGVALVGVFVFGPVVRKELAALERGGVTDADFLRRERQAAWLGAGTIAGLLAILALMVLRPF